MRNTKFIIPILILIAYSSVACASVGEVSGYLYFNFTNINQPISNHWTLVNTGNASVNFTIIPPKYDNSLILIETNITNGIILANSRQTILVTAKLLQPANFSGMIAALFPSGGNINLQISKQLYINDLNKSQTPKNAANTTKPLLNATTKTPSNALNIPANATTTIRATAPTTVLPTTALPTTTPTTTTLQAQGSTLSSNALLIGAGIAIAGIAIAAAVVYSMRGSGNRKRRRQR